MLTTTDLLTVEEFLALPEVEGVRRELLDGEIIEMSWGGGIHEHVKSNFSLHFTKYLLENPVGGIYHETCFRLSKYSLPIPDLSLQLNARLEKIPKGHFQGAPDLAIEVVSSESAATLHRKVRRYLECGSRAVLVAYHEQRTVMVYDPKGVRILMNDDTLELDFLPGFRVPVSAFFEGLASPD